MKCRILTVLIFLLLGAILNIAVAWVSTAAVSDPTIVETTAINFAPQINAPWRAVHGSNRHVSTNVRRAFGTETRTHWWCEGPPSRELPIYAARGELLGGELVAGWPAFAVGAAVVHGQGTIQSVALAFGRFPVLPLWPGFALNMLFYAAILWLLFALPGALRRWRRIKRGLCPACAYPVGASDFCTECGKPVTTTTSLTST